jgi:transposase-like protein
MSKPSESDLRGLYERHGGNIVNIAEEIGRPSATVNSWYRSIGLRGAGRGGQRSTAPPKEQLLELWTVHGGNIANVAASLGVLATTASLWYKKLGLRGHGRDQQYGSLYPRETSVVVPSGRVIAFSDAHWWEPKRSAAHEALLKVVKAAKPVAVIANGDIIDGASISRHDPSGLESVPTIDDELFACRAHMAEIRKAAGSADLYYNLGNHCLRPFAYIARKAPEFRGMVTEAVEDHFPGWRFQWSLRINDELLVMHRYKGGQHATYNNLLRSGMSIATGHLHSQRCYPFTDAKGTRWGVDLGCLAVPLGPQFGYTEANPLDWRSGFVVFEFRNGKLQPPELVTVLDDGGVVWQKNERVA